MVYVDEHDLPSLSENDNSVVNAVLSEKHTLETYR